MPVRSLGSSVFRWPDAATVDRAVRQWASEVADRGQADRIGYYGSYARGDWGVGSDVDIVVVVADSGEPFERRSLCFDASALPVPADVVVYTEPEWRALADRLVGRRLSREMVWVYP